MPFKSEAQRRYMFSQHPEIAREFAAATPKGTKLPEHVKSAFARGSADALASLGFKAAAEEIRLKIPKNKGFHGFDEAFKTEGQRAQKKAGDADPLEPQASPDQPVEVFTQLVQQLDEPNGTPTDATRDRLDRDVAWGPPSHLGASGNNQGGGMGQPTGISGI